MVWSLFLAIQIDVYLIVALIFIFLMTDNVEFF